MASNSIPTLAYASQSLATLAPVRYPAISHLDRPPITLDEILSELEIWHLAHDGGTDQLELPERAVNTSGSNNAIATSLAPLVAAIQTVTGEVISPLTIAPTLEEQAPLPTLNASTTGEKAGLPSFNQANSSAALLSPSSSLTLLSLLPQPSFPIEQPPPQAEFECSGDETAHAISTYWQILGGMQLMDELDGIYNGTLKYARPELQANKPFVLATLAEDGLNLEYAAPLLQADKEVALAAVTQNGLALQYASPELQADIEIIRAAVAQNSWASQFAQSELPINKDVLLAVTTE